MSDNPPSTKPPLGSQLRADAACKWPAGTTAEDHCCWVCHAPTEYRQCKIICQRCGFTRDCSDP